MLCSKIGNLSIVTQPAIEPVTLDEALEHCSANSGIEDDWFNSAIKTARQVAEIYQRRAYIEQELMLSFNYWPSSPIYIPRPPCISIDNISAFDVDDIETIIDPANFIIDLNSEPARITPINGYSYPSISLRDINSFQITYTAGYGSTANLVPDYIKKAILIHVSYQWENKSGEIPKVPDCFYNLLAMQRIYL